MNKFFITLCIIIVLIGAAIGGYYYYNKGKRKMTFNESNRVLQSLQQGNERFVSRKPREHDYEKQILSTKEVQRPDAVVLSCMDSRSIPELAFDQGIGHIFTIRVAGNVINPDIVGSMEYATKIVGAKLIVVLGHTNCGAVKAACQGDKLGNLTALLEEIQPAVQKTKATLQKSGCNDPNVVDAIAKQNVLNMVHRIPQQSPIIADLIKTGKLRIVGGMYDVSTGKVTFFD